MNKEHYELNIKILLEKIAQQEGIIKRLVDEYQTINGKVDSMQKELNSLKTPAKNSAKESK